ncbi:hypothetical protein [Paractinoplanes rishiriensis]|uniref:Uncharacterized protein n=1 Tax=Paractinoplanes rishiriensis TaxID=1050105 RepID=A0A919MST2_9ACTN|nr:hypothetical protein [Actinoplanes rishiriensis]GIE98541.1 hypothetical protein Ari01nite_60060 [Actinoplanes rishiriensis]
MNGRSRLLVATCSALAVLAPLGTVAPAHASVVRFEDAAAAVSSDLAAIAGARGWTIAQARTQQEAADRLDRVRQAVAAVHGEEAIVGGMLGEKPDGVATLLIAGPATDEARMLATSAGVRLVDRQPFTAPELRKRASDVHERLVRMGYPLVVTAVDIASADIWATVTAKPGLPATSGALAVRLPDGVAVTVTDEPAVKRESTAFGGMRNLLTGAPMCTSGWSVVDPNGTTGVSTAGHCGVNQITHDGTTHNLALQVQHIGSQGDVEWGTTAVPEPDDFFVSPTTIRDVSAVEPIGNITLNETVRVYGRTTNAEQSTTVFALDVAITEGGRTSSRLVATTNGVTQPGDSGAPWFNGTVAFGSHVGSATIRGQVRSLFQVADLYDEALGVRVRTT